MKKELMFLLELFMLKEEVAKRKYDYKSRVDFVIAVKDISHRYDTLLDFLSMIEFLSLSEDSDFRNLCKRYTSFVRKFYRRIDNFY